jgi:NhaA family Na+:H+ antiporter
MSVVRKRLTKSFKAFFDSEKSSGIVMIICTIISLIIANSWLSANYLNFWQANPAESLDSLKSIFSIFGVESKLGKLSVELWINDLLMAIFFLLIGLELKRELYNGELSDFKNALLPIFAALGGIIVPAGIHLALNFGTPTQAGIGIPMATDIAFALGVLALLGDRVPASLKVFLTALAVIDDLCAIIVIAVFYTAKLSVVYLVAALAIWAILYVINRFVGVMSLIPYLLGGLVMWYFMLESGVHATIAGVLLAFAIPFSAQEDDENSPSHQLEHILHKPVAFIILPIFALANTGVIISSEAIQKLSGVNEIGIMSGLFIGKPIGITLFSFAVVLLGFARLPLDLNWRHVFGAGLLGGIGFTMSIFITNLAFADNLGEVNASKIAILLASLMAGIGGFIFLKLFGEPNESDDDMDTMDFDITEVPYQR